MVVDPGMCGCSLRGNREISSLTVGARTDRRPASGRREAEADDARAGEVRPRRSSCEACEQRRAIGRGVGWSQGRGPRGRRGNYTRDGLRAAQACHRSCTAYGRPVRQVLTGRPSSPAAGAVCPNRARTDLCGGRPVMGVPTAIIRALGRRLERWICESIDANANWPDRVGKPL